MINTVLRVTFMVAAAGALGMTTRPALAQNGVVFTTARVVEFRQIQGLPAWAESSLSRLRGAVWYFDNSGRFTLQLPNFGLPAIRGTFEENGGTLTFKGSSQSSSGYSGATTVEVYGTIREQAGQPVVQIGYVSGQSLGAVVNGTKFGSSRTSAWSATAVLQAGR